MQVGSARTGSNGFWADADALLERTWLVWLKAWCRYTDHAHLIVFVLVNETTMMGTVGGVACSAAFHVSMALSPNMPPLKERPNRGSELLSRIDIFEQPAPVTRPDTSCWLRTHAFASCLNAPKRCLFTSSPNHSEPTCPLLTTSRSTYGADVEGMRDESEGTWRRRARAQVSMFELKSSYPERDVNWRDDITPAEYECE